MANSLSSLNREFWSNEMQATLFVENSAVFLAGKEAASVLASDGRKFHKPIISKPNVGTYTPGTDIDDEDLTASDEYLEVDTFEYSSVYVDDTQRKQNFYGAAQHAAASMQKMLNNKIEQSFLGEISNAGHTVDAAAVGGSAGSNIEVTTSNILDIFTAAETKLNMVDAPMTDRTAVVGAHTLGIMRKYKGQRETPLGDSVLANGVIGQWNGWTIVYNNNLPFSATLGLATNPTANDTVSVAGVTWTFKAVPAAAGEVDIGADADASRILLANAINGSSTGKNSATGYFEVSTENRFILRKRGIVATDNASPNTMTLTGFGDIVVAETFTDGTDAWTSQLQKSWFGIRGATDLVVQMPTNVEVVRVEKRFGDRVKSLVGYGKKTFADGARVLVNVKINASNWV